MTRKRKTTTGIPPRTHQPRLLFVLVLAIATLATGLCLVVLGHATTTDAAMYTSPAWAVAGVMLRLSLA